MKKSISRRRPTATDRQLFLGRLFERNRRQGGGRAYTVPELLGLLHEHFSHPPYSLEKPFVAKTLYRDMEDIGAEWDRPTKTWRFTHRTALSEMGTDFLFSNQNGLALLMAQKALVQFKGTPMFGYLEPVFTKMQAQLPAEERQYEHLLDRIRFTAPDRAAIPDKIWRVLCEAINDGTTLDMEYRSGFGDKVKRRKVDPYALLVIGREWYLLGFDHDRKVVLVFLILRILVVADTDEPFKVQRGFNLDAYLADAALGYPSSGEEKKEVKLRFAKESSFAGRTTIWHPREKKTEDKQGCLCVSFKTASLFFVAKEVLAWGGQVEVLEPLELRRQVKAMAKTMVERHG